jgi:signal transduction histidine kinase
MRSRLRVTARTRLTLIYATVFALSGVAFVAVLLWRMFTPLEPPVNKQAVPTVSKPTSPPAGKDVTGVDTTSRELLDYKAQARRELRNELALTALGGLAMMTATAGGLGWLMAGRALRPVHAVSAAARRLSQRDLHQRIPVSGPHDELRELAETINSMLARLEQAFAAQQRFAGNASHELRGPLTTLRALVEVSAAGPDAPAEVRRLAASLVDQLDRQERVIDGLLALASSEHGPEVVQEVRLDELVRESLATLADEIDARRLTVTRDLTPTTVLGDPVLLNLLVDNLMRNAVRHNVPGGRIQIRTHGASLDLANTGAEVTAERLAELVEPFRRGARDRIGTTGAGLGLAIAEAVARNHDAQMRIDPRPGGGVRARITLTAGPTLRPDPVDPVPTWHHS